MRRTDLCHDAGRRTLALETTEPKLPALRLQTADGGRLLLRQEETPLLLGRVEPWNQGVDIHRLPGYRSPLPPLRSTTLRQRPDWLHRVAGVLAAAPAGPLHAGRWLLREGSPPAYAWDKDLVTDWPAAHLDWSGAGWNGIVPLRPLSPTDDGRVASYRKHLREGTCAPVVLWWISGLDGYLLLDGHDRLVAARAEGLRQPPALILALGLDDDRRASLLAQVDAVHSRLGTAVSSHGDRARSAAQRAHGDALARVELDTAPTVAWPLPGGSAAWDALARAHARDLLA